MTKVLVSLDPLLLERLDHEARARKVSRSKLLGDLARQALGEEKGSGARPEVQEALRAIQELVRRNPPPPGDSTQWIREDRDSHF